MVAHSSHLLSRSGFESHIKDALPVTPSIEEVLIPLRPVDVDPVLGPLRLVPVVCRPGEGKDVPDIWNLSLHLFVWPGKGFKRINKCMTKMVECRWRPLDRHSTIFLSPHSYRIGFYWGHQCSWTLTQANNIKVSKMLEWRSKLCWFKH